MEVRWQLKWDKDSCIQEALKYQSRAEFQKAASGAWSAAHKNGWLEEICSHMEIGWQPKWDKDSCIQEALKYQSRAEFQKTASGAWSAAKKNGWLDEICSHMEIYGNLFKRCIYAFEFSDNYVYVGLTDNFGRRIREHLKSPDSPVFQHMKNTGLVPISINLHDYVNKIIAQQLESLYLKEYINKNWKILNKAKTGALGGKYLYWTKERCLEKSIECKTRTEFINRYNGAYASSVRNGWFDDVCSHMISPIALPTDWNLDILKVIAQNYKTRKEFATKSSTAYEYARKKQLLDIVCSHMCRPSQPQKWSFEALRAEAQKYKTKSEFQSQNSSAYSTASKKGILNDICTHMKSLRKAASYWTKEECRKRALLYKTKIEFKNQDGSAYATAVREKWIQDICSHMMRPKPKLKWTVDTLNIEAQKYDSIKRFKAESQSAYVTAGRLGLLKQICIHMCTNNHCKR